MCWKGGAERGLWYCGLWSVGLWIQNDLFQIRPLKTVRSKEKTNFMCTDYILGLRRDFKSFSTEPALWIRIRIDLCRMDPGPDPGRPKCLPEKDKSEAISCFKGLDVLF